MRRASRIPDTQKHMHSLYFILRIAQTNDMLQCFMIDSNQKK